MGEMWEQTALAAGSAWLVAFLAGLFLTPMLRRLQWGQWVRDDGPRAHLKKVGTPTMGGLLFFLGLIPVLVVLWPWDTHLALWLLGTAGFGLTGFLDDFVKVVLKRPLGLKARAKIFFQIAVALVFAWLGIRHAGLASWVAVPFWGGTIDLGLLYPLLVVIMFLASANAVNITDGLDGLAAGAVFPSLVFFSLAARGVGLESLSLSSWALAGACLGFLWHNYHPARVFMGDTGSLTLGASLAALAVLTKTELLLLVAGGLFVIETLSVIIQVIWFQTTGKRVFLMSPLHHHFELSGWPEPVVTRRFWLVALAFNGLALWGLRGLI